MRIRFLFRLAALLPLLALVTPHTAAAQAPRRWLADPATELFGQNLNTAAIDLVSSRDGWATAGSGLYRFDGRYWRLGHRFTNDVTMYDLDLASPSSGWAGGLQLFRASATIQLARWDGTRWSQVTDIVQKDGTVSAMSGVIMDVQAFADGTAMAIGYSYPGTVVLRFDGAVWRDITPAGWPAGSLQTLSMVSPTEGWAAGAFDVPSTGKRRPAIMHLRDGQWTEEQLPSFAALGATALTMRSASEGWAVFSNSPEDPNGCGTGQVARYSNGAWSLVPTANHGGKMIAALELEPGTNRGWATLLDCSPRSRPLTGQIARFDNGSFTPETSGSRIMPLAYAILDDANQVALNGTTFMRFSAEALPTERAQPFSSGGLYFETTGHNVTGRFLQYYRTHGLDLGDPGTTARESLALFGYPLSEVFTELNPDTGELLEVQYFERARMEYHPSKPEPYKVLLGRLTVASLERGAWSYTPKPTTTGPGCVLYPETGYELCSPLRSFWERNGGLPVFGFPLTQAQQQRSQTDGQSYLTQYFERERLEHHPELRGTPYEVLLGLLGAEELRARGYIQ